MASAWQVFRKHGKINNSVLRVRDILDIDKFEQFVLDNTLYAVSTDRTYASIKWFLHNGRNVASRKQGFYPVDDQLDDFLQCCMYRDYYFKKPIGECVYVAFPNNYDNRNLEPRVMEWANTHGVKATYYDKSKSWLQGFDMIVVSLSQTDVII